MAPTFSTMALYATLLLSFLVSVTAQSIQPSNDSLIPQASQLILAYSSTGGMTAQAGVQPLTVEIGAGQTLTMLNTILIKGTIKLADPHVAGSISALTKDNIAYVSCDPNGNSSMISPTDVVNQIIANVQPPVQAILLFSTTASQCSLIGKFSYTSILSMTGTDASIMLRTIATGTGSAPPTATIMDAVVAAQNSSNGTSGGNSGSNGSNSTPAPTTAVAMSILYSITGIITLLFLVIIATGAIRAHRHPERYGPRGGFPGRPRQSRAKGLARAMLETLPIVKFGDQEPAKPDNQDVELEQGANHAQHTTNDGANAEQRVEGVPQEPEMTRGDGTIDAGIGPDTHNSERANSEHGDQGPAHLGCSICTEDFEKGEDVRVLPCNHKFHPACIDPWLLNVSGTCPLCRIDLRPAESHHSDNEDGAEGDGIEAPPLAEHEGTEASSSQPRGRVSRRIDAALLRNAPAHQRIAILRQMRQEQIENGNVNPERDTGADEQSRRASLTARLRDAFRIRTRSVAEPLSASETTPPTRTTANPTQARAVGRRSVELTIYGVYDGQTLRRTSTAAQPARRISETGQTLR